MGEIYKIINDFNDKIYVGKAKNGAATRWKQHIKRDINNDQYIHRAMKKYGIEHFKYEIIENNVAEEKLNEREKYWIKILNCKVPNGYNERDGGNGGGNCLEANQWCSTHPEEVKKNRQLAREKAWEWQKNNSELFKSIIQENQKKACNARKIPIICIETGITYESASEAAKQLNISSSSHISAACKGKRETAYGYHWKYIERR